MKPMYWPSKGASCLGNCGSHSFVADLGAKVRLKRDQRQSTNNSLPFCPLPLIVYNGLGNGSCGLVLVRLPLPVLLLHNQAVMTHGNCRHKVNIYNAGQFVRGTTKWRSLALSLPFAELSKPFNAVYSVNSNCRCLLMAYNDLCLAQH